MKSIVVLYIVMLIIVMIISALLKENITPLVWLLIYVVINELNKK